MNNSWSKIIILDTTLRDGDQTPGIALTIQNKVAIAGMLEKLNVDIIEAGIPSSSKERFNEVYAVAASVHNAAVSAWARALPDDIVKAGKALAPARIKHLHTSIPTSSIHRDFKLRMTWDLVLKTAVDAVLCAKEYCDHVEIGAEDATRTDPAFLVDFCNAVTEAGADVVNISDTVGYIQPLEFGNLVNRLHDGVLAFQQGMSYLSVHCHNDLGLATANTLRGLEAGARQAEVTLLGLGERAGNAPLEEVVMALKIRTNYYGNLNTSIHAEHIAEASRLVSRLTGFVNPPNKPLTGRNAYAHSSGIHQNGMAAHHSTYSIVPPELTGHGSHRFVLSRMSGISGFTKKMNELTGTQLSDGEIEEFYREFKSRAESQATVPSTDILMMMHEKGHVTGDIWRLQGIKYACDSTMGGAFTINLSIASQYGAVKKMKLKDVRHWKALLDALKSFFHLNMRINEVTYTITGDDVFQAGRFFMSAVYNNEEFCEDGSGTDGYALCAHCFISIINQITARFFSQSDAGRVCDASRSV